MRGPSLRKGQQALLQDLLPAVRVSLPEPPARLDLEAHFPRPLGSRLWLEIGFGSGEHLAWQAARNPDVAFLGAEPFVNGVARMLAHIRDESLENVRLWDGDARLLLAALPDACLDRVFVLHPDPWPKRRHWKRRIVNQETLAEFNRAMRPGAELRIASDIPDYIDWSLAHIRRAQGFEWRAERAEDWRVRPADWPRTRYAAKAEREGRKALFLSFRKR
jgi:tRNA (guanine-N7-)-methyltransferase